MNPSPVGAENTVVVFVYQKYEEENFTTWLFWFAWAVCLE
jgi:hypothetical protein